MLLVVPLLYIFLFSVMRTGIGLVRIGETESR